MLDFEVIGAMRQATIMGAGQVAGADRILLANGGPPGITVDVFREFFWPTAKKMIDMFVKRGFRVYLHWDNDMTHLLEHMTDLTEGLLKGGLILDLEKTDLATYHAQFITFSAL